MVVVFDFQILQYINLLVSNGGSCNTMDYRNFPFSPQAELDDDIYKATDSELDITYSKNHTIAKCLRNLQSDLVRRRCKCRAPFLPVRRNLLDTTRICSYSDDDQTCLRSYLQKSKSHLQSCPTTCVYTLFDEVASSSSLKPFKSHFPSRKQFELVVKQLRDKYINITDLIDFNNEEIFAKDLKTLNSTLTTLRVMEEEFSLPVRRGEGAKLLLFDIPKDGVRRMRREEVEMQQRAGMFNLTMQRYLPKCSWNNDGNMSNLTIAQVSETYYEVERAFTLLQELNENLTLYVWSELLNENPVVQELFPGVGLNFKRWCSCLNSPIPASKRVPASLQIRPGVKHHRTGLLLVFSPGDDQHDHNRGVNQHYVQRKQSIHAAA